MLVNDRASIYVWLLKCDQLSGLPFENLRIMPEFLSVPIICILFKVCIIILKYATAIMFIRKLQDRHCHFHHMYDITMPQKW